MCFDLCCTYLQGPNVLTEIKRLESVASVGRGWFRMCSEYLKCDIDFKDFLMLSIS